MRFVLTSLAFALAFPLFAEVATMTVLPRWVIPRADIGFELSPQERTRPIVVGDIVYIARKDGKVMALHRTEGYKLWEVMLPSGAPVDGAFSYGRAKLFVGDLKGNLYALHARDGSEAWHFKAQSEWLSPPVPARDRLFAATSNDEIFAIGEADGKEKWHFSRRGDEKMTIRGTGSPAVFGNEVYHGFSDGFLVALSGAQGKVLWNKRLRSRERFYDIDMAPYVDEKRVIAATFDGSTYSLDRLTGDLQWVSHVGSYGGFYVEEDKIYLSGLDGNVYSLDKNNGNVIWKTPYGTGVGQTPTKAGDYLVVTTTSDPVLVIEPAKGEVIWRGSLGAGTMAAATGQNEGWFYCMSNFGNLFSFELQKMFAPVKGSETIPTPSAVQRFVASN